MAENLEMLTIFRSADAYAEDDAKAVRELLAEAGLSPEVLGDEAPGVPAGAFEVRVPAAEAARAEEAMAAASQAESAEPGDASHDLDLVTLFVSDLANAEMEAFSIRAILDANNIPSVIMGTSLYPNLPFEVRVPQALLDQAQWAVAEAQAAGPEAAEEAEQAGESARGAV